MFVDTFIKRPVLASVCSLVIVLAGGLAIPTMPISQYPDVAPPTVSVLAVYTGANAETVETAVTTPLEQAINGVEGMLYMSSASTNSGVSQITVTFDVTRDQDLAVIDVQNRVNQALGRLPGEVRQTGITVQKSANNFILAAGVYAEGGEYDSLFLSNYLDPDHEYILWNKNKILEFTKHSYPRYFDNIHGVRQIVSRVDICRLLLLHHFGGVYADIDCECLTPIDDWNVDHDKINISLEPKEHTAVRRISTRAPYQTNGWCSLP